MHPLKRVFKLVLKLVLKRGMLAAYSALALGAVANATAAELTLATWNIAWLRSAPLSDADYAQCRALPQKQRDQLDERDPMRWICRSSEHYVALAKVGERIAADVIALQEVESVDAIYRVFPRDRYTAFVTGGPWIQRTGFAVRKGRAEVIKFEDYAALGAPMFDHPRYGADLTVRPPGGKVVRLLAVHLKSACHSRPFTDETMGRYDKPGNPPPCKILGDQVRPLEEWIDARAREGVDFVVMGDFNRRLDSVVERTEQPRDPQGRQVTLWKEIDDGDPPGARLVRATAGHAQIRNCRPGDRSITDEERGMFIDHIIGGATVGSRFVTGSLRQHSIIEGKITKENRDFLRGLSDHCPLTVRLRTP